MNLNKAKELAEQELLKWGLKNWTFAFHNRTRVFGTCFHKQKVIKLSKFTTEHESEDSVLETIKHEIAHALVGPGHAHDKAWQAMATHVGANPKRTKESSDSLKLATKAKFKYVMCYEGRIVKGYLRKPNFNTFQKIHNMWLTHRKEETYGKLYIESYNPLIHLEYVSK